MCIIGEPHFCALAKDFGYAVLQMEGKAEEVFGVTFKGDGDLLSIGSGEGVQLDRRVAVWSVSS